MHIAHISFDILNNVFTGTGYRYLRYLQGGHGISTLPLDGFGLLIINPKHRIKRF